ncbi:MAG TPA: DUF1254 domain-containing protein [Acidisphaera sp.]|nr:DUF1254 domain-containing protein [Acidisphaera sp.]
MITRRAALSAVPAAIVAAQLPSEAAASDVSPAERTAIAEEAFIYGFPMVMNYGVMYEYFIDTAAPGYKAPFNQLYNTARVYTPQDTTIVTPNSDTPYSFVGIDLRAEPVVVSTPEIEKGRYFSIQLIDMYTFNFGYAGSRTTGNGVGCFMVAGPRWTGETPPGITKVFRCETEFAIALIRTQLFNAADLENVKKIQAGYRAEPLSKFLNKAPPPAAPDVAWPKIDKQMADADPFGYLNFILQFCPPTGPAAVERPLRARFARIGIAAGKPFPPAGLTPEQKAGLEKGAKSGIAKIKQQIASVGTNENGWRVAMSAFGDRRMIGGNWTLRAAAAMAGIYGNDAAEALYPMLAADSDGQQPDCSSNRYTLTFPAGELPPVNAFWSVTMYDAKTQLLVANPIDRYLINSPMLPDLKKDPDGSITLYIQKESPGADKQPNWLPAPGGPIYVVMRLYWPKESALAGTWKPPSVRKVG